MRTNLAIGVSASITFDFVDGACSEFCLDDDDCLGGSAAAHCVPFIPQRGLPDLSAIGLCMRACEDDNDCRDETQTCRPIAARVTYEDARAAVDVKNVCLPAAVCGDGANDGSEACDDGNDIDGDGCSAACAIEACDDDDFPSVFDGINFGDTGTSTSAHFESICAGINFGFPRHEVVSKYSAPSDGTVFARLLQFDRDDGGLILSVRRSCDAVFAEIGCVVSEVNGSPSQLAVPVSAGDVYFVVDDAFGGTVRDVVPGSYELDIRFVPSACGDGIRGEGETCDGADVGGATCPDQLAGSIGSMACDVVCELDVSGCALVDDANHDQEPNFPAPANSNPYVEPFLGTLDPNTDIDCVSIELAASSIITAHIDDLHEGVCFDMNSSAVNILDATGDSLVFALGCFDDARTSVVEPGTYFVCVGDAAFTAVPVDYRLTIRTALPVCGNGITEASEECDTLDIPETRCASRDDTTVGTLNCSDACTLTLDDCEPVAFTDTEPNTLTDAIPFTDPVTGRIDNDDLLDCFTVPVTVAGSAIIVTLDDLDDGSCNALFALNKEAIVIDDDGVTALLNFFQCGRFGVEVADPGTYAVCVRDGESPLGNEFDPVAYVLSVEVLVPGCGGGFVDGDEVCDDGNVESGDGCSSTCTSEACDAPREAALGVNVGRIASDDRVQTCGNVQRVPEEIWVYNPTENGTLIVSGIDVFTGASLVTIALRTTCIDDASETSCVFGIAPAGFLGTGTGPTQATIDVVAGTPVFIVAEVFPTFGSPGDYGLLVTLEPG